MAPQTSDWGGGAKSGFAPPPIISARSAEKGIFAAPKAPRRKFSEILAISPPQSFQPYPSLIRITIKNLGDVCLMSIDGDQSFVVETDASNVAISATLNQNEKPGAFFSRRLNKPQKMYPIVEKEAMFIVGAIKYDLIS